jgi:hypothetical protein
MPWKEFHQLQARQAEVAEFSTADAHARLRYKALRLLADHLARAPPSPRNCERLERLVDFVLARRAEPVRALLRHAAAAHFLALQRLLYGLPEAADAFRLASRFRAAVLKDLARRDDLDGLVLPLEPPLAAEPPLPPPAGAGAGGGAAGPAGGAGGRAAAPRELDALVAAAGRRYYAGMGSQVPATAGVDYFQEAAAGVFREAPRP